MIKKKKEKREKKKKQKWKRLALASSSIIGCVAKVTSLILDYKRKKCIHRVSHKQRHQKTKIKTRKFRDNILFSQKGQTKLKEKSSSCCNGSC